MNADSSWDCWIAIVALWLGHFAQTSTQVVHDIKRNSTFPLFQVQRSGGANSFQVFLKEVPFYWVAWRDSAWHLITTLQWLCYCDTAWRFMTDIRWLYMVAQQRIMPHNRTRDTWPFGSQQPMTSHDITCLVICCYSNWDITAEIMTEFKSSRWIWYMREG